MPCLVAALALFFPRIAIILVLLFSTYLERAYDTLLWPILGFLFMPITTLAYAFGKNEGGSIQGIYLVVVVIAVLLDLGSLGGGGYSGRRRLR